MNKNITDPIILRDEVIKDLMARLYRMAHAHGDLFSLRSMRDGLQNAEAKMKQCLEIQRGIK